MEQKILCIIGRRQSGKTSLASYLTGYEMKRNNRLKFFDIDEQGNLLVNTTSMDSQGNEVEGTGLLDITRKDYDFAKFAQHAIWPYCKLYNFADSLKQALMVIFGVEYEQLFGTNEQKNSLTKLKWGDMPGILVNDDSYEIKYCEIYCNVIDKNKANEFMTAREAMQYFGTEVCRKMYDDCWADACYRDIQLDGYSFNIIADCRFPNEAAYMKSKGAKLIKLTKVPFKDDTHESELAVDRIPLEMIDYVLDNENMTIKEKNEAALKKLMEWGWIGGTL